MSQQQREVCAQGSPVAHAEEIVPLERVVGVGQHEEVLRAGQLVPPHARVVLATVRGKVRTALSCPCAFRPVQVCL